MFDYTKELEETLNKERVENSRAEDKWIFVVIILIGIVLLMM